MRFLPLIKTVVLLALFAVVIRLSTLPLVSKPSEQEIAEFRLRHQVRSSEKISMFDPETSKGVMERISFVESEIAAGNLVPDPELQAIRNDLSARLNDAREDPCNETTRNAYVGAVNAFLDMAQVVDLGFDDGEAPRTSSAEDYEYEGVRYNAGGFLNQGPLDILMASAENGLLGKKDLLKPYRFVGFYSEKAFAARKKRCQDDDIPVREDNTIDEVFVPVRPVQDDDQELQRKQMRVDHGDEAEAEADNADVYQKSEVVDEYINEGGNVDEYINEDSGN